MTLAQATGRGQTVEDILSDWESPKGDDRSGDEFFATVRKNLRRHRDRMNADRLEARRLAREAVKQHPVMGNDDDFDEWAWSQIVD